MMVNIPVIENFLSNSCFLILFLTTVYYWLKIIFGGESSFSFTGLIGSGSALCCITLQLVLRWVDSGHFPLSNLYESLIFLAWCLILLHIYIEVSTKTLFLGVLTFPAILCLVAFTDFSLPTELQQSTPLVPALQSNWLVMHVTVMIASYAALLLGCLIAIAYLIFSTFFTESKANIKTEKNIVKNTEETMPLFQKNFILDTVSSLKLDSVNSENSRKKNILVPQNAILRQESFLEDELDGKKDPFGSFFSLKKKEKAATVFETDNKKLKFLFFLDNLSYRTIGIGFCFLTLGILSGAIWANETWGNYWSWDPKETWAFITWLTFACYLHSRLVGGWTGSKPALVASFGFLVVWVCYLGVNLLGQGLHSYGFLNV